VQQQLLLMLVQHPQVQLTSKCCFCGGAYTQQPTTLAHLRCTFIIVAALKNACRFRFCGAVLGGQLYVVGGMAAFEAPDATSHRVSGSVMRYNPATNTWQTMKGETQQQQQLQQQQQQHTLFLLLCIAACCCSRQLHPVPYITKLTQRVRLS
jgi:hypothetical protein